MTGLLASVQSVQEARVALETYADIIDCKDPHNGALGALAPTVIEDIVDAVAGERPVSATAGDLTENLRSLCSAIEATAACGVDYVKFGLPNLDGARALIEGVRQSASNRGLIAVCFVDRYDPLTLLPRLADAGCRGVMVDTADKRASPLTEHCALPALQTFIERARSLDLLCGLAGRLRLSDVPVLLPLQPDYLGFRSALCGGQRQAQIDRAAIMQVRQAIPFLQHTATIQHASLALH